MDVQRMHDSREPGRSKRQVLIVGGGLTGLSAALFLAWHGVSSASWSSAMRTF